MITTGADLNEFCVGLNGDADIDLTLLASLIETGKTILEDERNWMVLRKTNTSKSASTSNTWQTAIDISTITDFSKFYGDEPIILFDGVNTREYYQQVPFDRRLEYKDAQGTFVFNENAKIIYLNGSVPFSGTLYINYVCVTDDIDLEDDVDQIWTPFPKRFLPILGFYAIGIHKGAVDYDSINQMMLPSNQAALINLKNAMEKWDTDRQMSSIESNDPTERGVGHRNGKVNRG